MSEQHVSRPAWLIFGAELGGQHVVYASRELDQVELEAIYDEDDLLSPWHYRPTWPPRLRYFEVRGRLRSFVVVVGASYSECLAKLADFGEPGEWRDPAAAPALGAGTPALTEETET